MIPVITKAGEKTPLIASRNLINERAVLMAHRADDGKFVMAILQKPPKLASWLERGVSPKDRRLLQEAVDETFGSGAFYVDGSLNK